MTKQMARIGLWVNAAVSLVSKSTEWNAKGLCCSQASASSRWVKLSDGPPQSAMVPLSGSWECVSSPKSLWLPLFPILHPFPSSHLICLSASPSTPPLSLTLKLFLNQSQFHHPMAQWCIYWIAGTYIHRGNQLLRHWRRADMRAGGGGTWLSTVVGLKVAEGSIKGAPLLCEWQSQKPGLDALSHSWDWQVNLGAASGCHYCRDRAAGPQYSALWLHIGERPSMFPGAWDLLQEVLELLSPFL